jgi:indolepyruvate ferredoxin oxidoreductase
VVGRRDEHGQLLVPGHGTLDVDALIAPLHARLSARLADRLRPLHELVEPKRTRIPLTVNRAPFYCSGCPHNRSTRAEPGTLVGGGIGCHAMVAMMDSDRIGDLVGLTCMGSEGAQWIGMAPFVGRNHIVQNLGDGTFFHSGSLAVRAAVAAGIDITYKLLYNGTVAMTGGQDAEGQMSVPDVAKLLLVEGVSRVIVTSDDPHRHPAGAFPDGVDVWDRSRFDEAQRLLADIPWRHRADPRSGLRRREPARPIARHHRHAGVPRGDQRAGVRGLRRLRRQEQLPLGAARRHRMGAQDPHPPDQLQLRLLLPAGRLPVVRHGHRRARRRSDAFAPTPPTDLADPHAPVVDPADFTVRLTGIGGTGVVTVSQIVGTAAMLAGRHVRGLDQTGLSQKAGPVVSDLRIGSDEAATTNHGGVSGIDCLLGFDLLVAASDSNLSGARQHRTVLIASTDAVPTGQMVTNPGIAPPPASVLLDRVEQVTRADVNRYLDAAALSLGLLGSTTTANILLLGAALQAGAIPVPPEAVEEAITLNGVAVESNLAALRWGGRGWTTRPLSSGRRESSRRHDARPSTN